MNPLRLGLVCCLLALLGFSGCRRAAHPPLPRADQKQAITKLDDLPRYTYPVPGKAVDVVTDPALFAPLAARVQADLEHDLATYDIKDKTTLKRLKGALLQLAILRHDDSQTLHLIDDIRALETKPAAKYITGLITESRIEAARQAGGQAAAAFDADFRAALTCRIDALPWPVVQAELKDLKGDYEIRSRNLLLGVVENEIEPAVAKTHEISRDVAERLIGVRAFLEVSLPLKGAVVAVLSAEIAKHNAPKADIWQARAAVLPPADRLTPVAIGIWDSGVDLPLFPQQTARGDDGKPLGIAFDLHSNPVPELLYPIGQPQRLGEMKNQIKGFLDIRSAIDSKEAAAVRDKLASIGRDEIKPYLEQLDLFGNFAHGTHVAGIAVAGNPAARIVVGRITFDYHLIPEVPTLEQARKDAAAYQATVDFFKRHKVRVVNMSWGGSLKSVEEALEANGVGKDAAERAKLARPLFDIDKEGLLRALRSAPEILFVTAAGNSDNDVEFDEVTPSSFRLPNLLTVGAVDQAGDETSFTSFGDNVAVYADGFEVVSTIPGGDKMPFSGTSMASPEVANLAAKLFAVDPSLTAVEAAELIRKGCQTGGDRQIPLIDPARTLGLLQARDRK